VRLTQGPPKRLKGFSALMAVLLSLLWLYLMLLNGFAQTADRRQAELLETALRNAAVSAYATEGVYPATLWEIKDRYGVVVDEKRFVVVYDIFADSVMPQILVLSKGEGAT